MRRISDTITRLQGFTPPPLDGRGSAHLTALPPFGSNPGALTGWFHVPAGTTDGGAMPLVVVLHGCTQTAAGYDRGAGWVALGERFGFAVLLPEQTRSNNANLCFNWFVAEDTRRDGGEAASIRQMIAAMIAGHAIDPARVFITGLSAGGAMTSAMLATYPEVFAGGAIIAGLPHGAATSIPQAFDRMRGHGHPDDAAYGALVRAASSHQGPWPTVSVWQGSTDTTVAPGNADAILGQWRAVRGLPPTPDREDMVDGQRHRVWLDAAGKPCVEEYRIAGMGHGTPLNTSGPSRCGEPAAYMLDVGISSTWHIAQGWGLIGDEVAQVASPRSAATDEGAAPTPAPAPASPAVPVSPASPVSGVQATIEAALRSAGLMR